MKIYLNPFIAISAVNGSNFQIEQQCPQCGAPIILDEADRILSCKFCRTRVYLSAKDVFRFYIPPAKGIPDPVYFIPYWRIKGLSFSLEERSINDLVNKENHGIVFSYGISSTIKTFDISNKYFDVNFLSLDYKLFPHSLGLRPQSMKLKFVGSSENEGKFIKFSSTARDTFLKDYQKNTGNVRKTIFIGETASIIYSPVYCADNRIYDAVLKRPLDLQQRDAEVEQTLLTAPDEKWHVEFLPLICPNCGADLPGEKDALIVFCNNCNSAWNPSNKNFTEINFFTCPEDDQDITYLPFWQLKVNVSGFHLETYSDLIKLANLPRADSKKWIETPFNFYAPAFKLNPALFLRWCRQLTVTPPLNNLIHKLPLSKIHPVTLSVSEALESTILTMASIISNKSYIAEMISSSNFTLEDFSLVLYPFKIKAGELVHTKLGFPLDINALNIGIHI